MMCLSNTNFVFDKLEKLFVNMLVANAVKSIFLSKQQ